MNTSGTSLPNARLRLLFHFVSRPAWRGMMPLAKAARVVALICFAAFAANCLITAARGETVTFEQNANGQGEYYPGSNSTSPDFYYPDDNDWSQVLVTGAYNGIPYTVAPSNWSTDDNTYPNSTADDVLIVSNSVTLDVDVTVGSLTLSDGATLDMKNLSALNVSGSLTDNGTIVVDSNQDGGGTELNFNGGAVSGTGAIILNYSGGNAQLSGTLTQMAGHTISGQGEITAAITNNSIVNANVSGGTLMIGTGAMVNNNLVESSNGALLDIAGITITQGTGGQLFANGGNVQFDDTTTISGGVLNSSNGGTFVIDGDTTFNAVTNNGTLDMKNLGTLNVSGSLTDNGTIVVDSNQDGGGTELNFNGGAVSGTGAIILNSSGGNAQLSGTLTQMAGHTISGQGEITAALTNNSIVNADVSGGTLTIETGAMVNNNLVESSNGALLDIAGITITQGTGGQLLANGGNVQFDDTTTISGGVLNSSNGGTFVIDGDTTFNAVTNNGTLDMKNLSTLNVSGSLTDNGTIVVDSNQAGGGTELNFNGGAVSGTGAIILNSSGGNAQLSGTLTQMAGHTISGQGEITAALTNNSIVNANVSGGTLTIETGPMVNNNLVESSNGGVLDIAGITVTQGTGGQLLANGGNVQFYAATINGGALNSANGGVFVVDIESAANFNSLANNSTINMLNGSTLNVSGSLTDNGTIVVDSNQAGGGTELNFNGGAVSGTGAIILNSSGGNAQLSGTLTQMAGHTISGQGIIEAAFTNSGLVNANVSGESLSVGGATTNHGVMEASGGGTLSFNSGVLTNLSGSALIGGTYEALAGSTISLPGSITTNAATVILSGTGSTFGAINSLAANDGAFEVLGGQTFTTAGALTNYGAMTATGSGSMISVNGALAEDASASLAITGGATVSDASGHLGNVAGSNSTATVSGSGSTWTNTGNFFVGYSGTGALLINSRGLVVSDSNGYVGFGAGSNGTVTISGPGSEWSVAGALTIGSSGTGTVITTGGGFLDVTGALTIGSGGTLEIGGAVSAASATVNGGTVVTLVPLNGPVAATLGAGGVTVNTDGNNSTFTAGTVSGVGGVTKTGAGTLTLEMANTYTGATKVNAGGLALTTGASNTASLANTAITVASGATLSANLAASHFSLMINAGTTGSGTAGATLTLSPGSTFSMAGSALATFNLQQQNSFSGPAFTIGGALGLAPTLVFDIGNAAAGTDLLHVTKTVSVLATGGDITVDALAGDTTLTAGSYDLITSAGGFSGTNGNGLALSGTTLAVDGTTYDLSLANSTADDEILTVSDAPVSSKDLLAGHAGAPLISTASVPEPCATASLLSVSGLAAASLLRRRRE